MTGRVRTKGREKMRGNRGVWLLAICCFMLSCSQQFILGVPDRIAASAGVTLTEVGQLVTVFGLSSALGTPAILVLTSRWTQRSQLVLGLALMGLGMLVMGSTSNYAVLLAARVAMGAGNGVFTATATAMATKLAKPGHEGSALSNVMLGFSLAQVLAMPMARTFVVYGDWHWFYLALGVFAFGAAIALSRFLPGNVAASAQASLRERFAPLANPVVAVAIVVMMVMNTGFATFYTYVTPFLESVFGSQGHAVSTVLLIAGSMSIVGSKGSGWVSDRFGCTTTIPIALSLQGLCLLAVGLLFNAPVALAVALCLWVVFDWSFVPAQNLLLTRIAGSSAPMAIALSGSGMQLGSALGSAMGGTIILDAPLSVLPFVAAGCVGCAFVLELFVLRGIRPNRRAVKEVAET